MAELHDPIETGMPRSVKFGIAAVIIFILFAWFLPRKVDVNGKAGPKTGTTAGSPTTSDRETEHRLSSILEGLAPEHVVISTKRLESVADLGQWAGESLTKGDAAAVTVDREANAKWFSGEALKEVNDPTFSPRDGHHITMANLAGDVVTQLAQKTSEPDDRIGELFDYVVRQTTLMPDDHDAALPGTPFEALLIGRATAARRAWAFAVLLRQLRIDAVILEPKSKPESWLIGVIAPAGDVLLYDPRLGTGIPSAPGPEGFKKAATLAMVKEKPDLFRTLDSDTGPYSLTSEDLNSLNVKLITDSSTSSERMARLQTMITGQLMEIFDGVGKSQLREQGLADRVIAAGAKGSAWGAGDVAVWNYPEKQAEAFMSSGAEESQAWKGITEVFAGPIIQTTERLQTKGEDDAATRLSVKPSDQPLRLVRVDHLKGRLEKALPNYGRIRDSARPISMVSRDPAMREELLKNLALNKKAADRAVYWIALCQLEQNPKLVTNTVNMYANMFPQGEMIDALPDLLATAMAAAGDQAGAVRFLESGQRTPRREVLLKQWRPVATTTEKPAEETPKDEAK